MGWLGFTFLEDENNMIVNNHTEKGIPVSFSMDRMSKTRLDWIKANVYGIKPSGSMIIRRALAMYTQHIERTLSDPDLLMQEMVYLKAAAGPEECPWKRPPDFSECLGKPLSQIIKDTYRGRVTNFLNSSPFAGRAMAAKRRKPIINGKEQNTTEA